MSDTEISKPNDCAVCIYRSFLFENLAEQELLLINQNKKEKEFGKGETIIREGMKIKEFLYLRSGLVKIHKNIVNRHDQIIGIAKPLDFIGLLSIFSNDHYIYSITAIEPSWLCFVDLDIIRGIIEKDGKFAHLMLQKMSRVSDQLLENRIRLNLKNMRGRIASILLQFAKEIFHADQFELPVSRKEIGELVDVRTENVVRILSEFRKDGLIDIKGKVIILRNIDLLTRVAEHG